MGAILAFIAANKWARYALEALVTVAVICLFLGFVEHHGYARCTEDRDAKDTAAALMVQSKITDALSAETIDAAGRAVSHETISKTIENNHDTDADAPAPAILRNTISGLYRAKSPN